MDVRQQPLPRHADRLAVGQRRGGILRCGGVFERDGDGVNLVRQPERFLKLVQPHMQLRAIELRLAGAEGTHHGCRQRGDAASGRTAHHRHFVAHGHAQILGQHRA